MKIQASERFLTLYSFTVDHVRTERGVAVLRARGTGTTAKNVEARIRELVAMFREQGDTPDGIILGKLAWVAFCDAFHIDVYLAGFNVQFDGIDVMFGPNAEYDAITIDGKSPPLDPRQ